MAEMTKRPRIRSMDFEVKEAGVDRAVKCPDLNDVLRGVVIDLRNAWGLSTRALSMRLGVRQQTMSGFLDKDMDQGTRVDTLSRMCGALGLNVAELFALHPGYDTGIRSERAWSMVKNSLDTGTLEKFIEAVLIGAQIGVLPSVIDNMHTMIHSLAKAQGLETAHAKREAKKMAAG